MRFRSVLQACLLALGAVALLGVNASPPASDHGVLGRLPSLALTGSGPQIGPAVHVGRPRRGAAGVTSYTSFNWSGYGDVDNVYTTVKASWVQPKITCTKEDQIEVAWVGLDGWSDSTVEQDGTEARCYEGTASYYDWWEMYPTNSVQQVHPIAGGDHVTASVTYSGTSFVLAVTDATTAADSFSVTETCSGTCNRSSAEFISERPANSSTGMFPLGHITTWTVTGAVVKTATTSGVISTFPTDQITMMDTTQAYPLSTPGALNAKGNGFADVWDNSY